MYEELLSSMSPGVIYNSTAQVNPDSSRNSIEITEIDLSLARYLCKNMFIVILNTFNTS